MGIFDEEEKKMAEEADAVSRAEAQTRPSIVKSPARLRKT